MADFDNTIYILCILGVYTTRVYVEKYGYIQSAKIRVCIYLYHWWSCLYLPASTSDVDDLGARNARILHYHACKAYRKIFFSFYSINSSVHGVFHAYIYVERALWWHQVFCVRWVSIWSVCSILIIYLVELPPFFARSPSSRHNYCSTALYRSCFLSLHIVG